MKDKNTLLGHAACFTAYAIFGVNIVTTKDLSAGHIFSPLTLFCLRALVAGSLFWIISFIKPTKRVSLRDLPKIFVASVLGFFLTQYTFLSAIPHITPMNCSIITSMSPIYTMFIAAIAVKEPVTLKKAAGVLLSFAGIIYLILNSTVSEGGTATTSTGGIVLMVVNSISFALYLGIFRPLISKYSVAEFMKWIFTFGVLMSLPFSAKELVTIDYAAVPGRMYMELLILVFFATFVAYSLLPVGQRLIRPTLVSMYSYAQPLMAIAISIAVGMDTLTFAKILACLTVFGGVVLVNFSRSAGNSATTSPQQ